LSVQRSGCRVQHLGFRGHRFGFHVSGFGFRVSGLGSRVSGFGIRDSGFGFQVSGSGIRDSGFGFRDSGFRFWVSRFKFRVSGFGLGLGGCRGGLDALGGGWALLQRERPFYWQPTGPGAYDRTRVCSSGRGTTKSKDAQGTHTQSHIAPSKPVHEDYKTRVCTLVGGDPRFFNYARTSLFAQLFLGLGR
jgi:hypothetical protein